MSPYGAPALAGMDNRSAAARISTQRAATRNVLRGRSTALGATAPPGADITGRAAIGQTSRAAAMQARMDALNRERQRAAGGGATASIQSAAGGGRQLAAPTPTAQFGGGLGARIAPQAKAGIGSGGIRRPTDMFAGGAMAAPSVSAPTDMFGGGSVDAAKRGGATVAPGVASGFKTRGQAASEGAIPPPPPPGPSAPGLEKPGDMFPGQSVGGPPPPPPGPSAGPQPGGPAAGAAGDPYADALNRLLDPDYGGASGEERQAATEALRREYQRQILGAEEESGRRGGAFSGLLEARKGTLGGEYARGLGEMEAGFSKMQREAQQQAMRDYLGFAGAERGREQQERLAKYQMENTRLENEKQRAWSEGRQEDAQRFQAQQDALGREFEAGQAERGREFGAEQAELGREFGAGQAELGREFEAGQAELGREFGAEQAELSRKAAREIEDMRSENSRLENEKQRAFAEGRDEDGQAFQAEQNELNRKLQEKLAESAKEERTAEKKEIREERKSGEEAESDMAQVTEGRNKQRQNAEEFGDAWSPRKDADGREWAHKDASKDGVWYSSTELGVRYYADDPILEGTGKKSVKAGTSKTGYYAKYGPNGQFLGWVDENGQPTKHPQYGESDKYGRGKDIGGGAVLIG